MNLLLVVHILLCHSSLKARIFTLLSLGIKRQAGLFKLQLALRDLEITLAVCFLTLKLFCLELQFCLGHLQLRVLRHLLSLLLLGLLRVTLQQLSRCLGYQTRQLHFSLLIKLLIRRGHRNAKLFLNLLPISKRHVLSHVSHDCTLHLLSHRALPHHLHDHWILQHAHVRGDMSLVVLIDKRLCGLTCQEAHVL